MTDLISYFKIGKLYENYTVIQQQLLLDTISLYVIPTLPNYFGLLASYFTQITPTLHNLPFLYNIYHCLCQVAQSDCTLIIAICTKSHIFLMYVLIYDNLTRTVILYLVEHVTNNTVLYDRWFRKCQSPYFTQIYTLCFSLGMKVLIM